jgi:Fe-only nitrogenase, delta subunit
MDDLMHSRMAQLEDYIMKNCLWQFHSRSWDRRVQNEGILTKTTQILCGEPVAKETPLDKCHWTDAVILAEEYQKRFPWLKDMPKDEIKALMDALHKRLDYTTIDGSLNLELTDQHY